MDTQLLLNNLVPRYKSPKYSTTFFSYSILNNYQFYSKPKKMNNHHDAYYNNDGWNFEENKAFENFWAEFDNDIDDTKEENGSKRKREEVTKRPRARAIPWKEEEHK